MRPTPPPPPAFQLGRQRALFDGRLGDACAERGEMAGSAVCIERGAVCHDGHRHPDEYPLRARRER